MWIIHNGKTGYQWGAFYVDGEHPLFGSDRYYGLVDKQWRTDDIDESPAPKIPSCLHRDMSVEEAEVKLVATGFLVE